MHDMPKLIMPDGYYSKLDLMETEKAIKLAKDTFESKLANNLNLIRVSAPLMVESKLGINDNLNGIERVVHFDVPSAGCDAEIVQSLAKWKRFALKRYSFAAGEGLYTDMNAIRRDEELDNLHSIYVDQWDWECIINKEDRTEKTLVDTVKKIYMAFKETEAFIKNRFSNLDSYLPDEVFFISSQELLDMYPDLDAKERENAICKDKGAVFIMKIGGELSNGDKHDGRAPDYDDWELNGDLLFNYPVLGKAVEVSSMGIRVSEESMARQLEIAGCNDRRELPFHKALLNGELPYTIGGGIGQSRLCMFFLNKAHIGEVQASLWSQEMIETCRNANIFLL